MAFSDQVGLKNKIALITEKMVVRRTTVEGASSGIGEETALHFAQLGCCLALNGRNCERLEQCRQKCIERGLSSDQIFVVPGDLTVEENVKEIVSQTVNKFGRIDILVYSAGILADSSMEKFELEKYDLMMKTNVRAPISVCHEVAPHLIKTKGNIVIVSSFSGIKPTSGVLFYGMSKAALDQFVKCITVEMAEKGVRVNSINPGVVKTTLHLTSGFTEERYKKYMEDQSVLHPIGRYGMPEDCASAIAFLASDQASFITGVSLLIDGGRACVCPRAVNTK